MPTPSDLTQGARDEGTRAQGTGTSINEVGRPPLAGEGPASPAHAGAAPGAGRKQWIGLVVLALPCILVTMDLTILLLAVPSLTADLGTTSTELLWITDIYGFLMAGSLVAMGALGDRLGRRRILVLGVVAFAASSMVAALATTPEMLIGARALQGIAGASVLPSTMALVFGMFVDPRQRAAALGGIGGSFALGAALGPLVGGGLLEGFSWPSVFVPNVVVGVLVALVAPLLVPETRCAKAPGVDLASAALSVVGVLAVVYAIKELATAGVNGTTALIAGGGVAALGALAARQPTLTNPLIPFSLFTSGPFSAVMAASGIAMSVVYGTTFFTAQYFQLVLGLSPLQAGLWGLPPVVAMMVVAGGVVPQLARRVRPACLIGAGMAVTACGLVALSRLDTTSGAATLAGTLVVVVVGLAPMTTIGPNLIIGSAPAEQAGSVSGLGQSANELGGALGIALLGTLGTAVYRHRMSEYPGGASDSLGSAVGNGTLSDAVVSAATAAFTDGMSTAAVVGAALLVVTGALVAFALRKVPATGADADAAEPRGLDVTHTECAMGTPAG